MEIRANPRPFFIVGVGRSGTTMLQRLLNRHSQVCVPLETHFIPRLAKPFVRLIQRNRLDGALDLFNRVPIVKEWNLRVDIAEIDGLPGEAAYARAVDALLSRKAAQDGKIGWGEKTPEHIYQIPLLRRLFPVARLIHIYRDGRDVAISTIPLTWGPNNIFACALDWKQGIETWCEDRRLLGTDGLEVRYEDFVRDPEPQLQRICSFLDLPYEGEMLSGYTVHRNRVERWRNKFYLSPFELRVFESVAGGTLRQMGYKTSSINPAIPPWLPPLFRLDDAYKRLSNVALRRGFKQLSNE